MTKRKTFQERELKLKQIVFWLGFFLLAFILSYFILVIVMEIKINKLENQLTECQEPEVLKSKVIYLNDSNVAEDLWVVEYLCDENVYVSNYQHTEKEDDWEKHFFYASTWEDGIIPHSEGKCFIKYKE